MNFLLISNIVSKTYKLKNRQYIYTRQKSQFVRAIPSFSQMIPKLNTASHILSSRELFALEVNQSKSWKF